MQRRASKSSKLVMFRRWTSMWQSRVATRARHSSAPVPRSRQCASCQKCSGWPRTCLVQCPRRRACPPTLGARLAGRTCPWGSDAGKRTTERDKVVEGGLCKSFSECSIRRQRRSSSEKLMVATSRPAHFSMRERHIGLLADPLNGRPLQISRSDQRNKDEIIEGELREPVSGVTY